MSETSGRARPAPGSTRGEVLGLLRRAPRTVAELAGALGLSDNAVRQHLVSLERDGLVMQRGRRPEWTGKPAYLYEVTAAAEALYPKAYDAVLAELLSALERTAAAEDVEGLLREVGRRLGTGAAHAGPVGERAQRAAAVLTSLGGLAEVQESGEGLRIQGYSCPLAAVTRSHPLTCRLAEALVEELVGVPVRERCERGERPRCAFDLAAP